MTRSTITGALRLALAVGCLAAVSTAGASAQSVRRDTILYTWTDPAIATLVLVDSLAGPNARAVVIRRPGDLPNNIILVTRSTSAADLSKAVTALAFSRRNKGDRVDREMRTTIVASTPLAASGKRGKGAPPTAAKPTRDDRRAEADLRRLPLAPAFTIAGIARGPAIGIRMSDRAVGKKPVER